MKDLPQDEGRTTLSKEALKTFHPLQILRA